MPSTPGCLLGILSQWEPGLLQNAPSHLDLSLSISNVLLKFLIHTDKTETQTSWIVYLWPLQVAHLPVPNKPALWGATPQRNQPSGPFCFLSTSLRYSSSSRSVSLLKGFGPVVLTMTFGWYSFSMIALDAVTSSPWQGKRQHICNWAVTAELNCCRGYKATKNRTGKQPGKCSMALLLD